MQLQEAMTLFINSQIATTAKSYEYPIRAMRDWLGPARLVTEIRPRDLVAYTNHLKTKNYAPASEQKHIKTIKTFFNWLVKIEELETSPARILKQKRLPAYISRDKAMTDDELTKLLDYVKWHPRDHALILFIADTGCRAGGAAGLRVEDVDLQMLQAMVTEKGDKTRPVWFGRATAAAIAIWLLKRPKGAGAYIFSRDGHRLDPHNISQAIRRNCRKVGIRPLGAHSLRHRKGHQMADTGVAVTIAATVLGHSDPTITLRHYFPADLGTAEKVARQLAIPHPDSDKIIPLPKTS